MGLKRAEADRPVQDEGSPQEAAPLQGQRTQGKPSPLGGSPSLLQMRN